MDQQIEAFKRGQVEWAIWRFFTHKRAASEHPPKVFLTRIKRLLETDRHDKVPEDNHKPLAAYAFSSAQSAGQGVDAVFTPFDTFCLGLALDLVDFGFKPSEIVFLLRHLRPALESRFKAILRNPPPPPIPKPPRSKYSAFALTYKPWTDERVFWVIQKVEVKEIYPKQPVRPKKSKLPLFEIKFCLGIEQLTDDLTEMNQERWGYRKALVLEIAHLADGLTKLLAQAPVSRRGRG